MFEYIISNEYYEINRSYTSFNTRLNIKINIKWHLAVRNHGHR